MLAALMRSILRKNTSGDRVLSGTLASLFAPFWRLDAKGGRRGLVGSSGICMVIFICHPIGFIAFELLVIFVLVLCYVRLSMCVPFCSCKHICL
jgi:hypothetical protein